MSALYVFPIIAVPSAPMDLSLRLLVYGELEVEARWFRPKITHGRLRGYRVIYGKTDEKENGNERYLTANITRYIISGLGEFFFNLHFFKFTFFKIYFF